MRWIVPAFVLGLCVCNGCSTSRKEASPTAKDAQTALNAAKKELVIHKDPNEQPVPEQKGKIAQPRKIRYTADLRLIVEDFATAEEALDTAIKDAKADLANSETNTSANTVKSGTWRIRVPVDQFAIFRKAILKIGEVEKNTVDSEDMTDKYYDLDAHIKNRVAAREAMRDLLKETGKRDMEQYLKVYDKLELINDEINRKEGQLRLWANLTDLTTVTVHLREKQKFIADKGPQSTEIPTFGMRAGKTWAGSWDLFLGFWEGVLLILIALAPWLPIPLVLILGGWLIGRRVVRKAAEPVLVVVETPPESAKK